MSEFKKLQIDETQINRLTEEYKEKITKDREFPSGNSECGKTYKDLLKEYVMDLSRGREEIIGWFEAAYKKKDEEDKIEEKYTGYISKIKELQEQLNEIEDKEKKLPKLEVELQTLKKDFYELFPEDVRQNAQEYDIVRYFDYLKDLFNKGTGWFKKFIQKKKHKDDLNKLQQIHDSIKKTQEELKKLSADLTSCQNKKEKIQSALRTNKANLESIINHQNYIVDKLAQKMNEEIALFQAAFDHPVRDLIPPLLSWGELKEPVCFFQQISLDGEVQYTAQKRIESLLNRARIFNENRVPELQYHIHRHIDYKGNPCLELITPFYSPENARDNIIALMRFLSRYGVHFNGVVVPVHQYQMDPAITVKTKDNKLDDKAKKDLLDGILGEATSLSFEDIEKEYFKSENLKIDEHGNKVYLPGDYLFRGQSFATSDPKSSYATPTWRAGRMGITMAGEHPIVATYGGYKCNNSENCGETLHSAVIPKVGGKKIGILSVFKRSEKNVIWNDFCLETATGSTRKMSKEKRSEWKRIGYNTETYVNPTDNPLVARYLIYGDAFYLIDEKDENWKKLLDSMTPDLNVTYNTSNSRHAYSGDDVIRLIERYREPHNDGSGKVHDLEEEQIHRLGAETKAERKEKKEQFKKGRSKMTQPKLSPTMREL